MTVELCKHSDCISEPQGVIGTTLVCIGYFKYVLVLMVIIFYCIYFRNTRYALQDPEIIPTYQDTDNYLTTHIANMPNGEACSICMESNYEEISVGLECGHFFHLNCLRDWVRLKGSCPMCRSAVQIN